jgi:hypothetical protein
MKRLTILLAAAALAVALGAGCAHRSHVHEHYGESVRTLRSEMIAHPEAGDRVRQVEGLPAETADHVTDGYHQRQAEAAAIEPGGNHSTLDNVAE